MALGALEVAEGLQEQSADEEIVYTITTTNWASGPSNPSAKAYLEPSDEDKTSTVFPVNSPTADGDVITLSPLKALTKGSLYRVEVKFTAAGNVWECYFRVRCRI